VIPLEGRPGSPSLSIVIPAYNEVGRLPVYLDTIRAYFDRSGRDDYEVLVVDDGSQDGTGAGVIGLAEGWPQLRLIRHERNQGKGAAVRTGMRAAAGRLLLFADADGATPFEEEASLRDAIEHDGVDLAIGSRKTSRNRRAWHRGLFGRLFSNAVKFMLPISARDTQCGFKMFRHEAGKDLFSRCTEDGYLFDLHILGMAEQLGYRLSEVDIRWSEVPGSKVRLVRDSWRMLAGLPRLRRAIYAARSNSLVTTPRLSKVMNLAARFHAHRT